MHLSLLSTLTTKGAVSHTKNWQKCIEYNLDRTLTLASRYSPLSDSHLIILLCDIGRTTMPKTCDNSKQLILGNLTAQIRQK